MGIEPTYAAWEAAVLPLNYTRSSAILALAFGACGLLQRAMCMLPATPPHPAISANPPPSAAASAMPQCTTPRME